MVNNEKIEPKIKYSNLWKNNHLIQVDFNSNYFKIYLKNYKFDTERLKRLNKPIISISQIRFT